MTSVSNIASIPQPQANDNQRAQAKDFAQELAKQAQEEGQGAGRDARSSLNDETSESPALSADNVDAAIPLEQSAGRNVGTPFADSGFDILDLYTAITSPVGITENLVATRVFGWHAAPQAFLSEWTLPSSEVAHDEDSPSREQSSTTTEAAPALAPMISPFASSEATEPRSQGEAVRTAATEWRGGTDEEPVVHPDEALPPIVEASAPDYWAMRSLRYTRSTGEGEVAWLRDFRIREREVPDLISSVLSQAKANGLKLRKIILNGREAWASSGEAITRGTK